MPTGESNFPKEGGDPLYASEVNRFNPKRIGQIGGPNTLTGSTTAFQSITGSIVYVGSGAGAISDFLVVHHSVISAGANSTSATTRVVISGVGLNNVPIYNGDIAGGAANNNNHYVCKFLTSGTITASGGNIGSNYVFFAQTRYNAANDTATHGDLLIWGH